MNIVLYVRDGENFTAIWVDGESEKLARGRRVGKGETFAKRGPSGN